jgi:hypothetical protein
MSIDSRATQLRAGSLLLDPKNARIPPERRSDNQRQLLHELLSTENVRALAQSIANKGLFNNERLVVTPSGKRHVVLEGNRRLAAVRLLMNPELAPTANQVRFFRALSAKADLSALGKIDVVIVPDRLSAAPIIAEVHTGEAKKRWSSLQQARFYRELCDDGLSPPEIAAELGMTLGEIRSYLRTEKLHRIAATLELAPEIKSKVLDVKFPLTTLERFIDSQTGRNFLGIELDEDKGFIGKVHPDRFQAVLKQIVSDIVETNMSRRVNDEQGFAVYVAGAGSELPKTKMRGSFDPDDMLPSVPVNAVKEEEESKKPPPKRQSPQSASIVPRGFTCRSKVEKVCALFKELKSLKLVDHRNSTGVMLRVLVDVSLWIYLVENGHENAVRDHFDPAGKRRQHNPDWTPPLRDLISYCVENRLFAGMTAAGYKAVRSLASKDANYFITINGFNEFTHNPHVAPTEGDLRALWERAEPMLEVILG